MKRVVGILLIVVMIVLVACGTNNGQGNDAYTKEFPHIPKHPSMVFDTFNEAESEDQLNNAVYIIEDEEYESFLDDYEEILIDDGWEVVEEAKPISLTAEKDDKISVFMAYKVGDTLMLTIFSR